jgi:hypothetical protein
MGFLQMGLTFLAISKESEEELSAERKVALYCSLIYVC